MSKNRPRSKASVGSGERLLTSIFEQLKAALSQVERALEVAAADSPEVERLVLEKPREYAKRVRVNVRDVRRWVGRGMPHVRVDKKLRIVSKEADLWLRAQQKTAVKHDKAN